MNWKIDKINGINSFVFANEEEIIQQHQEVGSTKLMKQSLYYARELEKIV